MLRGPEHTLCWGGIPVPCALDKGPQEPSEASRKATPRHSPAPGTAPPGGSVRPALPRDSCPGPRPPTDRCADTQADGPMGEKAHLVKQSLHLHPPGALPHDSQASGQASPGLTPQRASVSLCPPPPESHLCPGCCVFTYKQVGDPGGIREQQVQNQVLAEPRLWRSPPGPRQALSWGPHSRAQTS